MKENLQNKIETILYFLEEQKSKVILFLKRNLKFILPILIISFILIPEILIAALVYSIAFVFLLLVIKKTLTYFIATGLFLIQAVISIIGFVMFVGIIAWLSQLGR